jgi:putative ATP-dependent endonuclease of OLD family
MYLSELKLWNFRKYGNGQSIYTSEKTLRQPDLTVPFVKGINVLIGENDSGKTAIIDAIKLTLKTHSYEWIKPEVDDFHGDSLAFRIECHFEELEPEEAKNFIEWLTIYDKEKKPLEKPKLKVILEITRNEKGRIFNYDVKSGPDNLGKTLDAEALLSENYLPKTFTGCQDRF